MRHRRLDQVSTRCRYLDAPQTMSLHLLGQRGSPPLTRLWQGPLQPHAQLRLTIPCRNENPWKALCRAYHFLGGRHTGAATTPIPRTFLSNGSPKLPRVSRRRTPNLWWTVRHLHEAVYKPAPCQNCGEMTYYYKDRPQLPGNIRAAVGARSLVDRHKRDSGWLCDPCRRHRSRTGVLPTEEEYNATKARREVAYKSAEARAEGVVCGHCSATAPPKRVRYSSATGMLTCHSCLEYHRITGGFLPSPRLLWMRQARVKLRADRQAGLPIKCFYCGKLEVKGRRLHALNDLCRSTVCYTCSYQRGRSRS